MSLKFAQISQQWAAQTRPDDDIDEAEQEGVNILHKNNPRPWNQCTCQRCLSHRYKMGIRALKKELGREPSQQEVAQRWEQIQREAGLI